MPGKLKTVPAELKTIPGELKKFGENSK